MFVIITCIFQRLSYYTRDSEVFTAYIQPPTTAECLLVKALWKRIWSVLVVEYANYYNGKWPDINDQQ